MKRVLLVWLCFSLGLGACTQRMICPAYQSSFIYDKEALKKKFSYFKEDSTPKILTASKNKYLVAVPESYRKKLRNLQTVEMKSIYPVIPDSLKLDNEKDLLMTERDVIDSTAGSPADSVYAITKTKEKYNVDQDIYMWYFREQLVMPDVRAAMEKKKKTNEETEEVDGKGGKKGLFGGKRKNDPTDSTLSEDASTVSDSTTTEPAKKGLGGLFKKKKGNAKQKNPEPNKKDPANKEEDDGF